MILGTVLDELERRNVETAPRHPLHRRRHGHRNDNRAGLKLPSRGLSRFTGRRWPEGPDEGRRAPAVAGAPGNEFEQETSSK
jgi:hypothetical protein